MRSKDGFATATSIKDGVNPGCELAEGRGQRHGRRDEARSDNETYLNTAAQG